MDRTLFAFIWRYSKRQQLVVVALTVVSFPILYMSLELPKWIINDAISGTEFPKTVLGLQLDQVEYLIALCLGFLGLVVLNNGIKYALNIYKGIAGERMLRRLRFMLYNAVLRFRLPRFRKVSGGEIIPQITAEVEDVGVFIGEAIATPAFQGGTLLVYIVFIFAQDPFLGAAAISLYPVQAVIIPRLQKRVIQLSRERIRNTRSMAERISESVGAVPEIRIYDTSRYHLADLSDRLFTNYRIRLEIFKRKYMIKFVNNFMNQLPPFFFYSVGGYLVLTGSLSFGALVAVLAAYKDLASPWKELLDWYQNLANVSTKYETVVENFDVDDAIAAERLAGGGLDVDLPNAVLALSSVNVLPAGGGRPLEDVTLEIPQGRRVAVYGSDGSGRTELLYLLSGLIEPTSGRATLGGRRIEELSHGAIARRLSFVSPDPFVFNDTIRSNVVYGIRVDPLVAASDERAATRRLEAQLTGNSLADITAEWEDHALAGVDAREAVDERLLELFALVGLEADLYRLGLSSSVVNLTDGVAEQVLAARAEVKRAVREDPKWRKLVDLWHPEKFVFSATLGENALYAVPADPNSRIGAAADDPAVVAALKEAGILDVLVGIGAEVAKTMIELFADTGADASLFGDYSFISTEETPRFIERLRRRDGGLDRLPDEDLRAFLALAFRLVPARHRIVTIPEADLGRIVAARPSIQAALAATGRYALLDAERIVAPLSIEENILFGKPRADRRGASDQIDGLLRDTIRALGLREPIGRAGLAFNVGVSGGRLSASQRRRLGLVRALLKRPDVLLLDSVADGDRGLIGRIIALLPNSTIVAGTADPNLARAMQTTAVMRDGRLVAQGSWDSVKTVALDGDDASYASQGVLEREAS